MSLLKQNKFHDLELMSSDQIERWDVYLGKKNTQKFT